MEKVKNNVSDLMKDNKFGAAMLLVAGTTTSLLAYKYFNKSEGADKEQETAK